MLGLQDDQVTHFLPKGPPPIAKIILVLVISLGLMTLDNAHNTLDPLRDSLATVLQPLQVVAELPADAWEFASKYINRDELIAKNDALARQVLILRGRLQKLAALNAENERLRNLMASGRALDDKVIIAEILSVSPSPYRHYVKLNKGAVDGLHKGQALVDGNGIMGQIVATTPMSATAIMITDPNHTIPVEINRTGLQTIARGRGKAQQLLLPFLPANADVRVGDLLVSSGLGGGYPAGYPVATVTEITHDPGSEFLTVIAEPEASLNRGREVLVIWSPPREPKPAEQPATPTEASDHKQTQASDLAAG